MWILNKQDFEQKHAVINLALVAFLPQFTTSQKVVAGRSISEIVDTVLSGVQNCTAAIVRQNPVFFWYQSHLHIQPP